MVILRFVFDIIFIENVIIFGNVIFYLFINNYKKLNLIMDI